MHHMIEPINIKNKLSNPKKIHEEHKKVLDLQGKTLEIADPNAVRALVTLMDMEAVMGGAASHFGGPSALAEINSVLYALAFESGDNWSEKYNLINDAGHCENGLYALKALYGFADLTIDDLKKFRSIESPLTGHGESHLFPEGVLLSNGPLGSSLAQAQGLCLADALKKNDRMTVVTLSDGGAMEGEAREALASVPGWAEKGLLNPFVLVISDNNTKLSGRIDKDSFSMQKTFDSLDSLGWKVLKDVDGHDLNKVYSALTTSFEEAKANPKKPVAIHFKTVKGKNHKSSEESENGGHGFPLKSPEGLRKMLEEVYGLSDFPSSIEDWITEVEKRTLKSSSSGSEEGVKKEKIQVGLSKAFIELKKEGFPLVSVSSDLFGSTGMGSFRKEFPESSFDVGIAESNMVGVGAGLSKSGFIPVVDTFAQFGVTKGALPLTMANLSQSPVIAVYSHTGFQDAADGASHQALSYFAMMSSIPDVDVVSLSCSDEAYSLVKEVVANFKSDLEAGKTPKSTVFFLGRENFPSHYNKEAHYSLTTEALLVESKNPEALVLTTGSLVPQAIKASEQKNITVISKGLINSKFSDEFKKQLEKAKGKLVILEDHQKISGFGSFSYMQIAEQFGPQSIKYVKFLGVNGEFGRSAYTASELYAVNGLDDHAVLQAVESL